MTRTRIAVLVLGVLLLIVLAAAPSVVFLAFAGLLFAIFLNSGGTWISQLTKVSERSGVAIFILLVTGALVVMGMWFAPSVAEQIDQLSSAVPPAAKRLEGWLSHYQWGEDLISSLSPGQLMSGSFRSTATSAVTSTFGGIGNLIIILFIGLYGALEPRVYRSGLLRLLPPTSRDRGREVIDVAISRLRHWLKAQFISMTAVGLLTALGLWAIGLPLPLLLGLIAAMLAFIPNIGPILACLPALSLALPNGVPMVVSVIVVYVAVQTLESYVLTPMIQRREVNLPPALILPMQVLLGVLFGILGLALATPLIALGIVLTRELYVRDFLEREDECPTTEPAVKPAPGAAITAR